MVQIWVVRESFVFSTWETISMELPFTKKGNTEWSESEGDSHWLVLEAPVTLYVDVNVVWAAAYMILKLRGDLLALLNLHVFGMLMALQAIRQNEITEMIWIAKLWDLAQDTPGQWGFGDEEPTEEKEQLLNRSKFESSILKAKLRVSQGWENTASTEEKGVGWIRHEGAVLVVQGLGIRLPGPRTRVRSLVGDWDPTCRRAAKPVSHNSRGDWHHNRRCHVLAAETQCSQGEFRKETETWGNLGDW